MSKKVKKVSKKQEKKATKAKAEKSTKKVNNVKKVKKATKPADIKATLGKFKDALKKATQGAKRIKVVIPVKEISLAERKALSQYLQGKLGKGAGGCATYKVGDEFRIFIANDKVKDYEKLVGKVHIEKKEKPKKQEKKQKPKKEEKKAKKVAKEGNKKESKKATKKPEKKEKKSKKGGKKGK